MSYAGITIDLGLFYNESLLTVTEKNIDSQYQSPAEMQLSVTYQRLTMTHWFNEGMWIDHGLVWCYTQTGFK